MKNVTSNASAIEINTGVDELGAYNKEVGAFLGRRERSVYILMCKLCQFNKHTHRIGEIH